MVGSRRICFASLIYRRNVPPSTRSKFQGGLLVCHTVYLLSTVMEMPHEHLKVGGIPSRAGDKNNLIESNDAHCTIQMRTKPVKRAAACGCDRRVNANAFSKPHLCLHRDLTKSQGASRVSLCFVALCHPTSAYNHPMFKYVDPKYLPITHRCASRLSSVTLAQLNLA